MNKKEQIILVAKKTIETEAKAITNLINLVDEEFAEAVDFIYNSKGRVIITGIGKSAGDLSRLCTFPVHAGALVSQPG